MGLLDRIVGFVNGTSMETPKEDSPTSFTLQENSDQSLELEDVEKFLAELYQSYANDIYRIEAKIIDSEASQECEINFLKVSVRQREEALKKIKLIINEVIKEKSALTEIERKSSYSFYEQLKADTMKDVKLKVFKIFAKIKSINVANELDKIILDKINKLRIDWNISPDVEIPDIADFRIMSITDEFEAYSFGNIIKNFIITGKEIKLSDELLEKIDNMSISLQFDSFPEYIWIQAFILERWQIDLFQKTAIFPNTYEFEANGIYYDVISKSEVENYIKGMLRILFTRGRYISFSIILPNENIKASTSNFISISKDKVTINNKTAFMLYERNKCPSGNYLVRYLDRFSIPETLIFKSFDELRYEFLPQYIDY